MSCMNSGRAAVITGSSRGLGRAIALELAAHGCSVAINYRESREQAEQVQAEIADKGGHAICVQADVSDQAQARQLIEAAAEAFGTIDILVNNAGINRDRLIRRMKPEDWQDVLLTNLNSVFFCTQLAVGYMIKQGGGHIVNIASVIGQIGNIGQSNYAAAKAGIVGFTRSAAMEFARHNITVNAICPGYIETDMVSEMSEDARESALEHIPLGRFGRPEEVAKLCRFLVSEADYITGAQIHISGGFTP